MSASMWMICAACASLAFYCWMLEKRVEKLEKLYLRTVAVSEWYEDEMSVTKPSEDA